MQRSFLFKLTYSLPYLYYVFLAFVTQFNKIQVKILGLKHKEQRQLSLIMHAKVQVLRSDPKKKEKKEQLLSSSPVDSKFYKLLGGRQAEELRVTLFTKQQ